MDPLIRIAGPKPGPGPDRLLLCDRDGTIIANHDNDVRHRSDVTLLPGAAEALRTAERSGFAIAIVSNQAVVGRGGISRAGAVAVHGHVLALLAEQQASVDLSLLCPHRPEDGCPCRKPAPGMLHTALTEFASAPIRAALVGDALEDMLAAIRAGVYALHVQTGRGRAQLDLIRDHPETAHVRTFPSIVEAVGHAVDEGCPA
jgi:D-glycero-D-manno-heptose 1,7-bisphosphate phosphatase